MAIGDSLRFRLLLDLGRGVLSAVDTIAIKLRFPRERYQQRSQKLPAAGVAVQIPCLNQELHGIFFEAGAAATASVLIFHGIGDRLHYWRRVQERLSEAGIHSLVFHYSGYRESGGRTTPDALERNARSAYAWLFERTPEVPILLLGSSLGTGLATAVADTLKPAPAGLILAESYTSLREAAGRVVHPLAILGRLMPDVWKTRENVARLRIPLLIVHSSGDELFPATMAEELYAAAKAGSTEVTLKIFAGYSHGDTHLAAPPDYWDAVVAFVLQASLRHHKTGLECWHGTPRDAGILEADERGWRRR